MTPTRLQSIAIAAATLVVATGCGDRVPSDQPFAAISLVPDAKTPRDDRFLRWGDTVTIAGQSRPALSSSKSVMPPAEITGTDQGQRHVGVRIPPEFAGASTGVFELVTRYDATVTTTRMWPLSYSQAGTTYSVGVVEAKVTPGGTPAVRLWPIPDLATRDLDTAEMRVPPHAVLQVGVGLEPASWDSTVVPVDMTVSTVAGSTATVLRTTRIDIRRKENRQWIDLSIPLDDLAGRAVRFRFSTRPMIGPSAVPTLPVWAEPTIVDARWEGSRSTAVPPPP
jgi:hypothetical protein